MVTDLFKNKNELRLDSVYIPSNIPMDKKYLSCLEHRFRLDNFSQLTKDIFYIKYMNKQIKSKESD